MDSLLHFFRKLWILVRREQFDRDLAEEMAFHREQAQKQLQTEGMAPEAAHDAAKRRFGNATRLKEESLETVAFRFETAWQDVRYAIRQLRKNAGFASTAILILAIEIGAGTAIFSAVNPVLFEPLPYPQAGRLMMISDFGRDGAPDAA